MAIDWKALLVGVGVTFAPIVILALVSDWTSALPLGSIMTSVDPPRALSSLLVAVLVFPGALAAGYLHGPHPLGGVLYGIVAGLVGFVVPAVGLIYLITVLIGVLSGELGVLLVVTLLLAFALPIVVIQVVVSGAVGGVLGSLLRRFRET